MFLSESDFTSAVSKLPLVSVDLCIISPEKKLLLVKRNSRPARHFYFTPGGRIRKNESIECALNRVAEAEVGLSCFSDLKPSLMGAWDHFYADSAFDRDISTHYINLPHFISLNNGQMRSLSVEIGTECQHDSYIWKGLFEASVDIEVHHYTRLYADYLLKNF